MKKYILISSMLLISQVFVMLNAQGLGVDQKEMAIPFFNKSGNVALNTVEMNALADTISMINHRKDDVVWSRIVYRVIDMREKQNNQLYFPITPNEKYKSLIRLILDAAVNDTLKAYDKKAFDMQPTYEAKIPKEKLADLFVICDWDSTNSGLRKTPLIVKNKITNKLEISSYAYADYVSKQFKFLVQEIVFFNKHYSRMYSKVIGIAPLYMFNETNVTNLNVLGASKSGERVWNAFQASVITWFLFDELRPFMAKQYIIPNGNESQRMTYDEFFAQKLYSSYLLGDGNMFDRNLLQSYNDVPSIRKEQKRIETELMNFEQDLWEY